MILATLLSSIYVEIVLLTIHSVRGKISSTEKGSLLLTDVVLSIDLLNISRMSQSTFFLLASSSGGPFDIHLREQFSGDRILETVAQSIVDELVISSRSTGESKTRACHGSDQALGADIILFCQSLFVHQFIFKLNTELLNPFVLLLGRVHASVDQNVGKGKEEESQVRFRNV